MAGHEMDVRNLGFDDATFDVAIDKGLVSFMAHFNSSQLSEQELWMP